MNLLRLFPIFATLAILQCLNPTVGGTGSTTETAITAMLYNPHGSPAAHAKVMFYPVSYNPRTGGLSKTIATATVDSATTDAKGNYTAKLDTGTYNILAAGDSGVVYQDSIKVVKDSTVHPPADTLNAPGSLRGVIRLQPGDDARKVFIIAFGTNTFGSPDDSVGNFTLANMAAGRYRVRIMSILDNYGVLDTSLAVRAGKNDTLADTIVLPFTGIPVPKGLKISYDTLKQIVNLSWNKPTMGRTVAGYVIYRKKQDSNFVKIKSVVSDTMFSDSTLRASGTYEYRVTAVDTQNTEGIQSAGVIVGFQNRLRLATNNPAFGQRWEHSSVAFNGKMWVIGGTNGSLKNDVWYSTDGVTWTQATDSANFSARRGLASLVFDNKMWVIGGFTANGRMNDVWNSSDGITWTQATDSAAFSGRSWHACATFMNKMWVVGGNSDAGAKNDVWYSSDGITWTLATVSAQFPARTGSALAVTNGEMWVIGGSDENGNYLNDVWYSDSGTTWIQATSSAEFSGRATHSIALLDSSIWVICGRGASNVALSDIWYSSNGVHWKSFNTPPDFGQRANHTSIVLNNTIWIIGLESATFKTEVWYLR